MIASLLPFVVTAHKNNGQMFELLFVARTFDERCNTFYFRLFV